MRVAVMGAGAVGCFFGGMLARAGHEVVLIGRAAHMAVVAREGLLMDTRMFQERVALGATTAPSGVAGADLILCCVKSSDTESAGQQMKAHLRNDAVVLSLQNGVDNAERLAAVLGRPVAPTVVYVATEMTAPGHLRHHGRGELVLAPFPGSETIVAAFAGAGVPVQLSDNITGMLWTKLILNCAYNALSAITQLPYGVLVQGPGISETMNAVVRECLAVADALHVTLPGDIWAALEMIARTMATQMSSTAQDMARGKPTEIDYLNGHVWRKGQALGIATPVNQTLHALVKLIESQKVGTVPSI